VNIWNPVVIGKDVSKKLKSMITVKGNIALSTLNQRKKWKNQNILLVWNIEWIWIM